MYFCVLDGNKIYH